MTNNLLTLIIVAALIGTFVSARAPEPVSPSVASRATTSEPTRPQPTLAVHAVAGSAALEAHQPPIPLVRTVTVPVLTTTIAPDIPVLEAEMPSADDLDMTAARAAIEADGYKAVKVLGKASDGSWRARAHRGTTEVQLTVDGSGRVSAE